MEQKQSTPLERKPFLINRALNKFLAASVVSAIAIQIAVMIDAIIVANFVGPDAMSAINVCTPVIAILANVGYMVSMGSTLLMSKAIGENNMEHGSHVGAVAIAMLTALGLVFAVTGCLLSDWMVSLLCSSAAIGAYAKVYLQLFFLLDLLPLFFLNALCGFTEAVGSPSVVTRAVTIGGAVNVLLDLLFVGIFHWAVAGAMYATVVNDLVATAILCVYLYRHGKLRFSIPRAGRRAIARAIMAEGIPLTIGEHVLMGGMMVLNTVIIYTLGDSGMFVWSVCMEIMTLVLIAMSGVETSMISIGGFIVGDDDMNGLSLLVRHALQVVCSLLLVLTLFILIQPEWVAMAFGVREADSMGTLCQALRIFSLSLVPVGIINLMRVVYQLMGFRFASGFMFSAQMLIMDAIIGLCAYFLPEYVWWAYPCSCVLMMGGQLAYTNYQYYHHTDISRFTLIPKASSDSSLDFSVPYSIDSLGDAVRMILDFANSHPASHPHAVDVASTCEEIVMNIIQYSEGSILRRSIDIHLHRTADSITFVIKDAGRPFNPMQHLPPAGAPPDLEHLGIFLMTTQCEQLCYNYMWGQNLMMGTFKL